LVEHAYEHNQGGWRIPYAAPAWNQAVRTVHQGPWSLLS
jgi:hypothetical protein